MVMLLVVTLVFGLMVGGFIGIERGIPFEKQIDEWSIGIYEGQSPLKLAPSPNVNNPVLTAKDVTDTEAEFLADPFMIMKDSTWYLFFELFNTRTKQGDIACATSVNGFDWIYKKIVLDEPFHLSYPYVFEYEGEYYLIPESCNSYSIRLYKAIDFPTQWSFCGILLSGRFFDSSIFYHNGLWWLFTTDRNDVLRLFYADKLIGSFTEHPKSPLIIGNEHIARPGGRVITFESRILRFAQDDYLTYGNRLRAFEVTTLTTVNYEEKEVTDMFPLQATGNGWNALGMHNVDPHQISENKWIACVDGYRRKLVFGWGY